MKNFLMPLAAITLALATPAIAEEFEKCGITPVDQVGLDDTLLEPGACKALCMETEGCDSWNFRPHSFDSSMPGTCKLIKGVFKKEESTKAFCGQL